MTGHFERKRAPQNDKDEDKDENGMKRQDRKKIATKEAGGFGNCKTVKGKDVAME